MKKFWLCVGAISLLGLFGCGDDSTGGSSFDTSSLSFCSAEVLKDSSGYTLICDDKEIGTITNGEQGVSGLDGAACTAESLDDEDGYVLKCGGKEVGKILNGESGLGCSGSSLKNGTGFALVCAGDTIGTISNGTSCTAEKIKGGYELSCGGEVVDTLRNVRDTIRISSDTLLITTRDTLVVVEKEVIAADTLVIVTRDSIFHLDTIYKALDTLFIGVDTTNSYGLGFCSLKREGQVAQYKNDKSLRNGSFYICEAGAWREAYRTEIDLALNLPKTCKDGDAQKTEIDVCHNYDGDDDEDYYGDYCYDKDLEDTEYYVCEDGAWKNVGESTYERIYYLGVCNSSNEGKTKDRSTEDDLKGYFKCFDGYWISLSEVEFKKGACTETMNGQVYDLGSKMSLSTCRYCESWYEDSYSSRSQYAMCYNGSWYGITEQVYEFGACTAKLNGTKKMYEVEDGSTDESYNGLVSGYESSNKRYYICSDYRWEKISEAAYKLDPCTEENVGDIVEFESFVYEHSTYGDLELDIDGSYRAKCESDGVWRDVSNGGSLHESCSSEGDLKKVNCSGCESGYRYYMCDGSYWDEISKDEYDVSTGTCEAGDKRELPNENCWYDCGPRYYICVDQSWVGVDRAGYVGGICNSQTEGKTVDLEDEYRFENSNTKLQCDGERCAYYSRYGVCRDGTWLPVSEADYRLPCNSSNYGEVHQFEDVEFVWDYYSSSSHTGQCGEGGWRGVEDGVYEFGGCTGDGNSGKNILETSRDSYRYMAYYVCKNYLWTSISETVYYLGECSEEKVGKKYTYTNEWDNVAYVVCSRKEYSDYSYYTWDEISELEYTTPCNEDNDATVVEIDGCEDFRYKLFDGNYCGDDRKSYAQCMNGIWYGISSVHYALGACTSKNEGDKGEYGSGYNRRYYVCESNRWETVSYGEYAAGLCTLEIKGKVVREEGSSGYSTKYYKCYQNEWVDATQDEYDAWVAENP